MHAASLDIGVMLTSDVLIGRFKCMLPLKELHHSEDLCSSGAQVATLGSQIWAARFGRPGPVCVCLNVALACGPPLDHVHDYCRDGEDSRTFLIRASERYLARHTIDGYSGGEAAGAELAAARDAVADGPADADKGEYPRLMTKQNGALTNGHAIGYAVSICFPIRPKLLEAMKPWPTSALFRPGSMNNFLCSGCQLLGMANSKPLFQSKSCVCGRGRACQKVVSSD